MFICAHIHTHTHKEYIFIDTKNIYLYIQRTSAETKGIHGKLTPIGHSQTQIIELKKITSNQNNLYYKHNNGNLISSFKIS